MEKKFELVDIRSEEFKKCVREIIKDASDIINAFGGKDSRFITLSDGWILDVKTGLQWGPSSQNGMNHAKAQEYCEKLGGRLPTVDELQTISDRTLYNPTVDKNIFKDVKSEWYWTSTKYMGCSGAAWCVSFGLGSVSSNIESFGYYVRPVRASQ